MEKLLGQEYLDPERRAQFLRDNCDKVEEKSYMRQFTNEELLVMKDQLADNSVKINDIEEAKKEAVAEFKRELDPLIDVKKRLLRGLKDKAESVTEEVFKFTDMNAKETGFYNKEGILIESRPAYGNELQGRIFSIKAANE